MDASELQARLQALAAQRAQSPAPVPAPAPAYVPDYVHQPVPQLQAELPQPPQPQPEWPTWVPGELLVQELQSRSEVGDTGNLGNVADIEQPVPADADPFFEQYFSPNPETAMYEPFDQLDDLRDDQEEAGNVKITPTANAAYRAKRTGLQGLIASVLIAIGGVLVSLQTSADLDWKLVGLSLGQAVLTAAITYLHNDNSAAAAEASE